MKLPVTQLALILLLQVFNFSNSLKAQQKINAVIPGDFADPSMIRSGGRYYATGTSSEWAPHYPIYESDDLTNWKQTGYIFDKAPEWTSGSFWAPEYYVIDNTYYLYYTARRKKDNISCIGVATSKYPNKGFKDHGVVIEHGKEAIDAFLFNDDGQLYITYKAYGLDKRPIEILGSRLSPDGLKPEGELFSMLKDDEGEGIEGQSILKKDGQYYLFYSAGNCCGAKCDYNVKIARSPSIQGPFVGYEGNPALKETEEWKCSGHGTFVVAPDSQYYYLYHAYNRSSNVFTGRQGLLAKLEWPEIYGWPQFKVQAGTGAMAVVIDSFKAKSIATYWQWDFRNSSPVIKQAGGMLHLSGTSKISNNAGVVLTVKPTSASFEITTEIVNHNDALKGLVFYGDVNAAIGVGARDNNVEFWMVKDNKKTIIKAAAINSKLPVMLKIKVLPDFTCQAFYRQGRVWKELATGNKITIDFLPQWDRSPRAGLQFKGSTNRDAQFSFFKMENL